MKKILSIIKNIFTRTQRDGMIDYIRKNASDYSNTDFSNYSDTQLRNIVDKIITEK